MASFSQPFQLVASLTLPSKPTGITAASTKPKQLSLTWTPDPATVPVHYTVFISTTGPSGPFTVAGTNLTSPTFVTTLA